MEKAVCGRFSNMGAPKPVGGRCSSRQSTDVVQLLRLSPLSDTHPPPPSDRFRHKKVLSGAVSRYESADQFKQIGEKGPLHCLSFSVFLIQVESLMLVSFAKFYVSLILVGGEDKPTTKAGRDDKS